MEEVEKYCQEAFGGDIACEARFDDLKGEAIDASQFDLPYDTRHTPSSTIGWTRVSDLLSDSTILAPTSLFSYERQPNDPLYSPRRGSRIFSTSGLAAGFSLSEAILHALCEVIERHALKLSEQAVSNPGGLPESRWPEYEFVDLQTCPPSTQLIVEAIRGAGYEVRALDITSDVSVPTFAARVMLPRSIHGVEVAWPGSCTHPSSDSDFAVTRRYRGRAFRARVRA
jgi:ribosomal protein S12 methylthiotransferase accessory factor